MSDEAAARSPEVAIVPGALAGERVDRVVAMLTGLTRAEVSALIEAGGVRVDGRRVQSRSRRVTAGEVIDVDLPDRAEGGALLADPSVEVPVVHCDDHVVVVDKPAGLVVHPGAGNQTGTLVQGLLARYPDIAAAGDPMRPGVVHRLDAGTSGLLVVARTPEAFDALVRQLSARQVERRYVVLVLNHLESGAGMIDAPLGRSQGDPTRMAVSAGGREARTRYEVRRPFHHPVPSTLLECRLETGRTHQIRVHLAAIGHPVVGDARYGGARPAFALPRPFLHAHALAFDHPATGERLAFESSLPPDLQETLSSLR